MTIPNDLDGFLAGYDAGKAAALEWAAGQVEAAGCICLALNSAENYDDEYPGPGFKCQAVIDFDLPREDRVIAHDPRCPVALAAKIREGAP